MVLQTLISANDLNAKLGQDKLVILDCRFYLADHGKGLREYNAGHIPNAIFVDLHHELAGEETELTGRHPLPEEAVFAAHLRRWGIESDSSVVVYDDMSGAFAARAWWMLSQQGIETHVLDGGITAWKNAGFATCGEQPEVKPAESRIEVSFPWAISENQVVENFETGAFQLVDARSADRFNGENETMDPVAGHIPGAINRPFVNNLQADGLFKSPQDLKTEWQDVQSSGDSFVYYCGSGVTACHNVLALNHAGIEAKNIYVGSWSQWAKRMMRAANLSE